MEVEQLIIKGAPMAKDTQVVIEKVPLKSIKLGRNSRLNIDPDELSGLMESIKNEGLLQPIGLVKEGKFYEIAYGNRRYLACSKLGMHAIPAIVHVKKKESDIDMKNLTENIQRRNISLTEAGRYIDLLKKQGLSTSEISVRLGVSKNYIQSCSTAFEEVPKEFHDDLETKVGSATRNTKPTPGKIAISSARAIVNASKTHSLNPEQKKMLFKAAKSGEFDQKQAGKYAAELKRGRKDFLHVVKKNKHLTMNFTITEPEHQRLLRDFIDEGPFNSMRGLFIAILKGEKNVKVNIID